jgi:hypothetical protein
VSVNGTGWHPLSIQPALQSKHGLAPPGKDPCQIKLVETWKWVTRFFSTVSTDYHRFHRLPPFPPITTISTVSTILHRVTNCHTVPFGATGSMD